VLAGSLEDAVDAYIRKDYATAMRLMRPLAEQGIVRAQKTIAIIYDNGQGVPQDHAESAKWYRKAAEQGDATAQSRLGTHYGEGQGVLQDYVEAHKWFNLAASQGDKMAAKNRGIAAKLMTRAQIAEAQRLAREWKPKK
jgi:TPR repeat protein